ncbi:hypothetical protein [Paenibacillus sp. PL91]|uniref:hypothetical protein n=1 Tax=Paenibacillus sp. PL91 TaxID=2729538 RepID=UPI001658D4B5|nr:hypothetical protein [Paenibacillus sp. PL91]MBC9202347.1 hypothetical protein [Paenibacillus sp. PL91]
MDFIPNPIEPRDVFVDVQKAAVDKEKGALTEATNFTPIPFTLRLKRSRFHRTSCSCIISTPRIPYVELSANGVPGSGFLRP